MKKVILMMLISLQLFAWGNPSEEVELKGNTVEIINNEKDQFVFIDSYSTYPTKDNYKSNVVSRFTDMFSLISEYGKKKGYVSYMLLNEGFMIGQNGLNSGKDIGEYCTLGYSYSGEKTQFPNLCNGKNSPILISMMQIKVKVVYFKDNSGNFSTTASY
ncbi:MAG: hypothetical protein NT103_00890 [Campylobacterales bacterium]|nr:hypothetical protein [Campylobacterales bacterium]